MIEDIKKWFKKLTKDEKIILGVVCVLFLLLIFGKDDDKNIKNIDNIEVKNIDLDIYNGMNIYCDKEKNVEYLIFKDYKGSTITKRYNEDNSVSNCLKPTHKGTFEESD